MRPEDLVFWLDRLDAASSQGGVLCLRHADSMIVPRSWTLDDLRDPDLHLFRPPAATPAPRRTRRATAAIDPDTAAAEQLEFHGTADAERAGHEPATADTAHAPEGTVAVDDAAISDDAPSSNDQPIDTAGATDESWSPAFDDADDLGGLLSARSPLLARAFRGDDRPRS